MSSATPPSPEGTSTPDAECLLERYGIIRVQSEHFLFRGYRYTNLGDAVAQAERQSVAGQ